VVTVPEGSLVGLCGDGAGGAFTLSHEYGSAPDGGPVVAYHDATGAQQWQLAATMGDGLASVIDDDGSGNAVFAGSFEGALSFGDSTVSTALPTASGTYLANVAGDGTLNWLRGFDSGIIELLDLAVGSDGEITICGRYQGGAQFPGVTLTPGTISVEGFVAHYDATGRFLWVRRYGATTASGSVQAVSVAMLLNGNSVVTSVDDPGVYVAGDSVMAGEGGHAGSLITEWDADGTLVDLFSSGEGVGYGADNRRPVAARADGGVFRFELGSGTKELVAHLTTTTDAPFVHGGQSARLLPNAPNPFNARTEVRFELARPALVEVTIHDLAGRHVRTLVSGPREAGSYRPVWDGRSDAGDPVASGVYLVRLAAGDDLDSRKIVLVE
jgi:hypothetical protein